MATTRRDYYEILGVPRNADERAIKSAFRRLARELHPDVSDHPEAQERFREAAEAYEVLSKAETRELYDRYGHDGLRTGGFRPTDFDFGSLNDLFSAFFGDDLFGGVGGRGGRRSARGADVLAEVEVTLVEAAEGATRAVPFPAVVDCATCHGSGAAPGTSPTTCPAAEAPAACRPSRARSSARSCGRRPALAAGGSARSSRPRAPTATARAV